MLVAVFVSADTLLSLGIAIRYWNRERTNGIGASVVGEMVNEKGKKTSRRKSSEMKECRSTEGGETEEQRTDVTGGWRGSEDRQKQEKSPLSYAH